jgi:hypothetical protein
VSENDSLRRTEKISLLGVDLLDLHFQDPSAGGAFALPFAQREERSEPVEVIASYIPPQSSEQSPMELSGTVGVLSLAVLVVVAALAVTRSRSAHSDTHSLLPNRSVHSSGVDVEGNDEGASLTPVKMSGDDLDWQSQTVCYQEDDLDIYGKYMAKKSVL